MFSVNYIFLLNITYIFAIITRLGFLVLAYLIVWAIHALPIELSLILSLVWVRHALPIELSLILSLVWVIHALPIELSLMQHPSLRVSVCLLPCHFFLSLSIH